MIKYIAIGVIAFLGSMLVFVPASTAAHFLPSHIVGKQFQGNIWQGSAGSLRINNVDIGAVSWKIKPACFVTFKLCADVVQKHYRANSSFELNVRNNLELYNVQASGDTTMFAALLSSYGITTSGDFEANLSKALFNGRQIKTIEGNIVFNSLVLNGVLRVSMGDVNSVFQPQADHTQIDIANQNGHIDLSAVVQLFTDMSYQVDMQLRQNANSDQTIVNGLQYLAQKQPDGSFRLQQKGQLNI